MALAEATQPWWRRNRLWLLALTPLTAACLVASSWQWWTIYRPNQASIAHRAVDGEVHLVQTVNMSGHQAPLDIRLRAEPARPVSAALGQRAMTGLQMYEVSVVFASDPQQPLTGCDLSLRDDQGASYLTGVGLENIPGENPQLSPRGCTSFDQEGPTLDPFTGKTVPATSERPEQWTMTYHFAIPTDRKPSELRVVWSLPHYAALPVG